MRTRVITQAGREVGAVGLGCMGMSWAYTESQRDDLRSVDVVRAALDLGVTFLDTADVYGNGHNEIVVGAALDRRRDEAFLATKVGLVVDDLATKAMHRDGTPRHVRAAVDASLRRLGVDVIDLYYLHRVDPDVPLAETWGAMAELVSAGKVRHLGLSEVSVAQADAAHAIHPVAAVQSEFSLWWPEARDIVGWCAEHGAVFVPFAPLGRGFLTGAITAETAFERSDLRSVGARFQGEARTANLAIVDVLAEVARRHDATPAQVALAWVLAQGDHIVPIPGTKRPEYLRENTAAADLDLTERDLDDLRAAPVAVGARY